jgi:hypothetical protein
MKITINIIIDGIPVGSEVQINGKPYSELVPDEIQPPEEIKEVHTLDEEPKDKIEHIFPKEKEVTPVIVRATNPPVVEWGKDKVDIPEKGVRSRNGAINGKRGPYHKVKTTKHKKRIIKEEAVPDNFLKNSKITTITREDIEGKTINQLCAGTQASYTRFIVKNTYFPGSFSVAKLGYEKYIEETAKDNLRLSWGSWLVVKYLPEHNKELIKRQIGDNGEKNGKSTKTGSED